MIDIDLSPIGTQIAPVLVRIFYFTVATTLIIAIVFSFITDRILKKYFHKIKPLLRLVISICFGILTSIVILNLVYQL